jgi:uncharacterized CHY-type Zn-finger protein
VTTDDHTTPSPDSDGDTERSRNPGESRREDTHGNDADRDDGGGRGVDGDVRAVGEHRVRGVGVDGETRCTHYGTHRDVVAIKFACCGTFYPCYECHDAVAAHDAAVWPTSSFDEPAILCGACERVHSIATYLDAASACPTCGHPYNPGCRDHAPRYFER